MVADPTNMTQTVAHWQMQAAVKDRLMRPLRDLRISVIDRCNYRCPYCMPAELFGDNHKFLPRGHWLTPGEIKRVASVFLQLGVKKLRLTGGEPLLRRDIVEIVAGLAELNGVEDLAITTNGSRLAEHASDLKKAGLKRITVSLDSIDPQVFREMNGGRGELEVVLRGIEAARAEEIGPVEVARRPGPHDERREEHEADAQEPAARARAMELGDVRLHDEHLMR